MDEMLAVSYLWKEKNLFAKMIGYSQGNPFHVGCGTALSFRRVSSRKPRSLFRRREALDYEFEDGAGENSGPLLLAKGT